jgi:hypothetical protein
MIVAIVKNQPGIVPIEQFRQTETAQEALDAFLAIPTIPPRVPSDWVAIDTGWSVFQPPAALSRWAYDFNTATFAQVAITPDFELKAYSRIIESMALAGGAFVELSGIVASPFMLGDPNKFVIRASGLIKTTGVGAQLRICQNGVPISLDTPLPNTADAFAVFAINTNVALGTGANVYTLEGMLGAAPAAELKYFALSLLLSSG